MAILDNPWVQEGKDKEGPGAMPIFPKGGSRIKIVHAIFGIRRGLAEVVVESFDLIVVMSEVSRLPHSVVARADKFWVSS